MATILYVDDEEINLDLFEISFFKSGFNIIKANSAEKGIEIMYNTKIDLVVSDYKMPGMDGLEFITTIKKLYSEKPCILITGYYEPAFIENKETQKLLYAYLQKPWNNVELKRIINEALI